MSQFKYSFTIQSSNKKTGPIPVTRTDKTSCAPGCAFLNQGCYAQSGPTNIHWTRLTNGTGYNLDEFCQSIRSLKKGKLWRHNEAGDLPHIAGVIDQESLQKITLANMGRKGFTYTHHELNKENILSLQMANDHGFTVNVSCETLDQVKVAHEHRLPAVIVVVPDYWQGKKIVKHSCGTTMVRCPAETMTINCNECRLCQNKNRHSVVGFTAHGIYKNKIIKIVSK